MLSGAGDAAQSVACFPSVHKAEFSPPPHIMVVHVIPAIRMWQQEQQKLQIIPESIAVGSDKQAKTQTTDRHTEQKSRYKTLEGESWEIPWVPQLNSASVPPRSP